MASGTASSASGFIELHRHLDVSTRLSTLLELAQRQGLEAQSTSLEAFGRKVLVKAPMTDLASVLATFTLFQKVLDRPETLERIAFETVEDCWNEGTRHVELRWSPSFATEHSGMSWDEALDAFERGVNRACARYPGMRAGMICIASRDYGAEAAAETAAFYQRHITRLVGLDLAGNEDRFPCRLFEGAFREVKTDPRSRITVHAGEGSGPENIWEAVELLGARRIGHGIAFEKDPALAGMLVNKGICLEMCPTSNWLTQAVARIEDHPLARALRAGVPVCINTDDPGAFGVTLRDEIRICETRLGMGPQEIELCFTHARRAAFF
jgi:adenosine deaminase